MFQRRKIILYEDALPKLFTFRNSETKVLAYVMARLRPGDVTVQFSWNECESATGLARGNIKRGIDRLCKLGILTRTTEPGFYYIDPTVFYKPGEDEV